jgi:ubiquinone/menaquinone biosynthesis C-methylase UbiE
LQREPSMNALSVPESHKVEVPGKFDDVASTYDLLTGANPGYHRHLRLSAARLRDAIPRPEGRPLRLLDLCCGTGSSTAALRRVFPDAEIVGLDASEGMLAQARRKGALRATFVHGDGMDPGATVEGPFDGILMAYGIRNMPDRDACLANLRGMLAPGGVIAFHEYSVADSAWATALWNLVCWLVIIPGGLITSPRSDIYRYLRHSVVTFDGVRAFEDRLARAGFTDVRTEAMDGWQTGVLHTFLARAPEAA